MAYVEGVGKTLRCPQALFDLVNSIECGDDEAIELAREMIDDWVEKNIYEIPAMGALIVPDPENGEPEYVVKVVDGPRLH